MRFIWPIDDPVITRNFYYLSSLYVGGQHAALDLIPRGRPATGEPLRAIANGTVVGVGWDFYSGFFVALDLADGYRCFYRHLFGMTPVAVGQRVSQGQIIGNVGNTGWSLGAHLHFDLWNRDKIRDDEAIFYKNNWYALDPVFYLGQEIEQEQETEQEDDDMLKMRFVKGSTGPTWVTDGIYKMGVTTDQIRVDLVNLGLAEDGERPVTDEFIAWLINYPKDIGDLKEMINTIPGGGGGAVCRALNKQEIKDEVKQAQREGTA